MEIADLTLFISHTEISCFGSVASTETSTGLNHSLQLIPQWNQLQAFHWSEIASTGLNCVRSFRSRYSKFYLQLMQYSPFLGGSMSWSNSLWYSCGLGSEEVLLPGESSSEEWISMTELAILEQTQQSVNSLQMQIF